MMSLHSNHELAWTPPLSCHCIVYHKIKFELIIVMQINQQKIKTHFLHTFKNLKFHIMHSLLMSTCNRTTNHAEEVLHCVLNCCFENLILYSYFEKNGLLQ